MQLVKQERMPLLLRPCRGFASQLPEAFPVALSVLLEAAGSVLLPWLATQPVLDEDACEASIKYMVHWLA